MAPARRCLRYRPHIASTATRRSSWGHALWRNSGLRARPLVLIERAVRKKVLAQKPYRDIDYVLALDDTSRIGALRFRFDAAGPFLAASTGKLPLLIHLSALLCATDAIHSE